MTQPPSLLIALFFLLSGRVSWGDKSNHRYSSSSSYTSFSCRDTQGPNFPSAKHEIKRECHTTSTLMRGHFASSPTHRSVYTHTHLHSHVTHRRRVTSLLHKLWNQVDAKLKWQSQACWWEHKCDFGRLFDKLHKIMWCSLSFQTVFFFDVKMMQYFLSILSGNCIQMRAIKCCNRARHVQWALSRHFCRICHWYANSKDSINVLSYALECHYSIIIHC